jgi:hypothetical protein
MITLKQLNTLSYPERRRDWPYEASATDFQVHVPTPASVKLEKIRRDRI